MRYDQGSIVATLNAVQAFLRKYADRLGSLATSGASKKIDESLTSLDAQGREQEDRGLAGRMATLTRVAARQALIAEHMQPIANVAAAELTNYRELTALHMPRLNVNDQALIQKARAMASAATAHEPVFSQGLGSAEYVANLETAADTLVTALQDRIAAVGSRQKATAGLAVDTRAARKRLRVIDRLVMAAIKKDPALVTEWNSAKQIVKKAGVPRTIVTAADEAPGATPTPAKPATVVTSPSVPSVAEVPAAVGQEVGV